MPWSLSLQKDGASCTIRPDLGGRAWDLALCSPTDQEAQPVLWNPGIKAASQGLDAWWHGGCPLLFPFAGRVLTPERSGQYAWQGQRFPMPLHGFGPRQEFAVVEQTQQRAVVRLEDSGNSSAYYPAKFCLTLDWQLHGDHLRCDGTITNRSPEPMPLALGWHPYFHTGIGSKVKATGFELGTIILEGGKRHFVTEQGLAAIGVPMPDEIKRMEQSSWRNTICSAVPTNQVVMNFKHTAPLHMSWGPPADFQHLVLWSDQPAFYCAEPWMGLPNAIENGQGLKTLAGHESWQFWLEIRLA